MMLEAAKGASAAVGTGATVVASTALPAGGLAISAKLTIAVAAVSVALGGGIAISVNSESALWSSMFGDDDDWRHNARTDIWSDRELNALRNIDLNDNGTDLVDWLQSLVSGGRESTGSGSSSPIDSPGSASLNGTQYPGSGSETGHRWCASCGGHQ